MTGPRTRTRRLFASAAAVALAVTGVALAAPNAEAAPAPRTYTAVMTPTTAVPGVETSYSVVVKNTSTVISALDHVVLLVPAGFSVVPGSVLAPRGGWTESLNTTGTELTAKTSQGLLYGLRKGESLTMAFSATDPTACDTATVIWGQKADGLIVDPFVAQSPDPSVQMTPIADRFVVTSVTDVNALALGNQVVKGDPITISGDFRCGSSLVAPTAAAGNLTLTQSAPGVPANSGALGGTLNSTVAKGDISATITGTTYGAVANQVGVAIGWDGGTGDAFSIDVLGAAASVTGTPGTAIPPSALTVPDAVAGLSKGANGAVAITIQACTDQLAVTCSGGTEVSLAGSFKNADGTPLYSVTAPARLTRVCTAADCPHPDSEGSNATNYLYNYECKSNACYLNKNAPFGEREVEEDFAAYPTFVSLRQNDGTDTPFVKAERCVPLPTSKSTSQQRYDALHTVGKILDPAAVTKGFCIDVNAISRTDNKFSGTLTLPILFVEDIRARP